MAFLVYRSSAGSGKTFALVKQYLQLALSHPLPDNYRTILAITFTNKAASEMKERILGTLKSIADGAEKGSAFYMAELLQDEMSLTSDELRARSAVVLSHMLHNYADLSISTIDKFMHRIIRTFAFDLQVPVDFEIETDEKELIAAAADAVIEKAGKDELITSILTSFMISRTDADKHWDIEREVRKFGNLLLDEDAFHVLEEGNPPPGQIMMLRNRLIHETKRFEETLQRLGQTASGKLTSAGIDPELLSGGSRGIGVYFKDLAQQNKLRPSDSVIRYVKDGKWFPAKAKAVKDSASQLVAELETIFNQILTTLEDYPEYTLKKLIFRNIYGTALLGELSHCLQEISREEKILPISSFNRTLINVVRNEPAPFIYERIGEKYRHFLIDEFQDTSVMQWHNLLPLLENGLSSGHLSMVVGDAKQSIYRWRGGDASQFISLPAITAGQDDVITQLRQEVLQSNFRESRLNRNYRSAPGIVNFNNDFFSYVKTRLPKGYQNVYEAHEQESPAGEQGYIHIEFVNQEKQAADELHHAYLERISFLVQDLIGHGTPRKDIAILTRANEKGAAIASELTQQGIAVISQESLFLASSAKVCLIISILKMAASPEDPIHRVMALRKLQQLGRYSGEIFWSSVKSPDDFLNLMQQANIETDLRSLMSLSLYDMAETVIRDCKFEKDADPYLACLLEQTHHLQNKLNGSLHDFLQWWEEKGARTSITIPEGIDAVKILSIHKAKGLEFPVVILPFADWESKPAKEKVWVNYGEGAERGQYLVDFNKQLIEAGMAGVYEEEMARCLLDDLNLLYVALTRPVNELFIISSVGKNSKNVSVYLKEFLGEQNHWEEGKQVYTFGNRLNREETATTITDTVPVFSSSRWQDHIRISHVAPEEWLADDPDGEQQRGLLMHRVLSMCDTITDASRVIQNMAIGEDHKAWLSDSLDKLSRLSSFNTVFNSSKKVYRERDLITADGEIFRPDRVIIDDNVVKVLDFKTGQKNKAHEKQVIRYGEILKSMGYGHVQGYLIYTAEPEIVEVTI